MAEINGGRPFGKALKQEDCGVLLLDRDPSARIGFAVRARNEFCSRSSSMTTAK